MSLDGGADTGRMNGARIGLVSDTGSDETFPWVVMKVDKFEAPSEC